MLLLLLEDLFIKKFILGVSILLFIGIIIFVNNVKNGETLKRNLSIIVPFHFHQEEKGKSFNYLLELRIPCISFQDYVYPIDSSFNTVDCRVEILKESNMDKNLYYFAAHSGNGKYSYFNRLIELKIGDVIILHLFNHQLYYVVSDSYLIDKKGYMISNGESDTLYLITCSLVDKKKQLIIQANLT